MPLGGLQHFTIEPQDLEHTKNFYVDVLGLEIGDRPPLDFPGYWLQATHHDVPFREQVVSCTGDTQIFLYHPDRVEVELNFYGTWTLKDGRATASGPCLRFSFS